MKLRLSLLAACLALGVSATAWAGPDADLREGIRQGKSTLVEAAILKGADVNAELDINGYQVRVLPWAARFGNLRLIKLALEHGADINGYSATDGGTALLIAINNNFPAVVQALLEHGARIKVKHLEQALVLAAGREPASLFRMVLASDAVLAVEQPVLDETLQALAAKGDVPLLDAFWQRVCQSKCSPDSQARAFFVAASRGDLATLQWLQQKVGKAGFSASQYRVYDEALIVAASNGQVELLEWIQQAAGGPGSLGSEAYSRAFINAAASGRFEPMKWLVSQAGPGKLAPATYQQALIDASSHQQLAIAQWLLDQQPEWPIETLSEALKAITLEFRTTDEPVFDKLQQAILARGGKAFFAHPVLGQIVWQLFETPSGSFDSRPLDFRNKVLEHFLAYGLRLNDSNEEGATLLMKAAQWGPVEIVKLLADRGADLKLTDARGQSALFYATNGSQLEVIQLLADRGLDLNLTDKQGQSALFVAARQGQLEVLQTLVDRGARLDLTDKQGYGVLYYALSGGYQTAETTDFLLARGIQDKTPIEALMALDIDLDLKLRVLQKRLGPKLVTLRNQDGRTLLIQAAAANAFEMVNRLVSLGADVRARDKAGYSAFLATTSPEVATLLLAKGAKLNETLPDGQSGLHLALAAAQVQSFFVDKGIVEDLVAFQTLAYARFLLGKGANAKLADKQGRRPVDLLLAAMDRSAEVLEWGEQGKYMNFTQLWAYQLQMLDSLLRKGTSLSPRDPHLLILLKLGLVQVGPLPDYEISEQERQAWQLSQKMTPLALQWFKQLIVKGNLEMREVPIKLEDNPYTGLHRTALMIATGYGSQEMVQFLLAHGASPNGQNADGNTPVLTAVNTRQPEILKLLLEKRPRLDLKDKEGRTALDRAIALDDDQLIALLKAAISRP
ncbi:MAG: ankyrin repeat domain-containing protein [Candidatus Sericytochromatia bacterium]